MDSESRLASGVYAKRDIVIARGKDATLWDKQGRAYIDCVSGQGVSTLGHANEAVARAIYEQAQTLISCPEIFYNDVRADFLELLSTVVPAGLNRFFLCNSGAEANETALKFARLSTGRPNVVSTVRGFHGRTMGALSATFEPKYREPFQPLLSGFSHVAFNNLEALTNAVNDQTAAVIVEAVQGEGGVHPASDDYLRGARALCRERGALLIIDEVQTGFARTGAWFACMRSGVTPDLMPMGKAIGGGVPMGADLPPPPADGKGTAPSFVVWAVKDPSSGNLDRIQVIKGWTQNGQSFEKVFDVVWSGDRKADKWTGRVPAIRNTVDLEKATYSNDVGATELKTVWTDPEFDASLHAFYYCLLYTSPSPRD